MEPRRISQAGDRGRKRSGPYRRRLPLEMTDRVASDRGDERTCERLLAVEVVDRSLPPEAEALCELLARVSRRVIQVRSQDTNAQGNRSETSANPSNLQSSPAPPPIG